MTTSTAARGDALTTGHSDARSISRGRLELARVWGISIKVHASWLLVFALVTWSLAAAYFPSAFPGRARGAYWLAAVLTALLFFLSILVHELGHSRVALRFGIPIRDITLFVFGGVAHITREPPSAAAELRIALAGPVTSLCLGALFAVGSALMPATALAYGAASWLARVNLVVALFNLVPGFPLDGGRVLRAIAWYWSGSFQWATSGLRRGSADRSDAHGGRRPDGTGRGMSGMACGSC